jgi:hypothetical protein
MHLQLAMHSSADCDPFGSGAHWPAALQLYIAGLQVAMHSPGDCDPFGSGAHWPVAALQLYIVSQVRCTVYVVVEELGVDALV